MSVRVGECEGGMSYVSVRVGLVMCECEGGMSCVECEFG